ncbi:MAG TPA: FAD-dependent oxidoreductase [Urbifossiella sp.]|nr:FAD-dependent oxidoreductase [Urbifossiella sp.]
MARGEAPGGVGGGRCTQSYPAARPSESAKPRPRPGGGVPDRGFRPVTPAWSPNPPGPPSLRGKGGNETLTSPDPVEADTASPEATHPEHPSPSGGGAGGGVETQAQPGPSAWSPNPPFLRGVELRDGSTREADWFVLAAPFDRVPDLLPPELAADPFFAGAKELAPSPITSVHLWYDRPPLDLPHAVLVDCLGQWVFGRGEVAPGEFYLQVVVSAARPLRGLGRDEVLRRIVEELARVFPTAARARLLRGKVVTEHAATFSAVPGVDRWRPPQATPVRNLVLAGDWTATGWPATMEGAVRSGYLAAETILDRVGRPTRLLRPDLGG